MGRDALVLDSFRCFSAMRSLCRFEMAIVCGSAGKGGSETMLHYSKVFVSWH